MREGISALRIYITTLSLYPQDRGVTGWYQSLSSHKLRTTNRQINGKKNCNQNAWFWLYNPTTSV